MAVVQNAPCLKRLINSDERMTAEQANEQTNRRQSLHSVIYRATREQSILKEGETESTGDSGDYLLLGWILSLRILV